MTENKKTEVPYENPIDQGLAADRINFGVGRKISDGNYGSYDFHCSMSTDVKPNETPKEAVMRCMQFAEGVINYKIRQGNGGKLNY